MPAEPLQRRTETLDLEGVAVGELEPFGVSVGAGEIVCLSGASGSGKTRLLRAVADLEPHAGDVRLGGLVQSQTPASRWRRHVMLVPAESQWWHETVGEHFETPMSEALETLALPAEVPGWSISRLSSGEKQRLALVRALSYAPGALLLDEPTANLDADSIERFEGMIVRWIAERGTPVIWVAHDTGQIKRLAHRHFAISERVVREAT